MNKTVRGNSYYLKINVFQNNGTQTTPLNLNDCDQVEVNIYQELTGQKFCHSTDKVSNEINQMIIDVSGLPCSNKYVIEVVGLKNSRAFRGAEIGHIGVTEYNEDSDPIFDDEVNITIDFVNNYLVVEKQQKHEGNLIEITYNDLVNLRNNSGLIKGINYRIIDYECTTTQENTDAASNIFDIIVTATDIDTLSETAKAIKHKGDTYFANNNLNAWELKYCIDNDTTRFAWADSENGKGVIYYMKDEFNNECPYDFKNIMFIRSVSNESGYYELDEDEGNDEWVYTFAANKHNQTTDEWSELLDGSLESPYMHMSDEDSSTYHDNVIKPWIDNYGIDEMASKSGLQHLNNIVFVGYYEYSDELDENDYLYGYCSFGNTFGYSCHDMSFNSNCKFNHFGNYCFDNKFLNNCAYNIFGNNCSDNNITNSFNNNCIGNEFLKNTIQYNCTNNIFGNCFKNNSLNAACSNNNFLNGCTFNTFGTYCVHNLIGNSCRYINFSNDCSYNTIGNDCQKIKFNYQFTKYVIVEQGNKNITLNCNQSITSSKYIRNVTIAAGTNNSTSNKSISVAPMTNGRLTVQNSSSTTQNV